MSTPASQSKSDDTFLGGVSKDGDPAPAEGDPAPAEGDPAPAEGDPAEAYDLELSDESPLTDEQFDYVADLAEKNGLTKEQADGLIKAFEDQHSGSKDSFEKARDENRATMKKELEDMPEFQGEQKIESTSLIKLAVDKLGNDDLVEALKVPEIGNNKNLAKFLMNIGSRLKDDSIVGNGAQPQVETSTMESWYGANGENKS